MNWWMDALVFSVALFNWNEARRWVRFLENGNRSHLSPQEIRNASRWFWISLGLAILAQIGPILGLWIRFAEGE